MNLENCRKTATRTTGDTSIQRKERAWSSFVKAPNAPCLSEYFVEDALAMSYDFPLQYLSECRNTFSETADE